VACFVVSALAVTDVFETGSSFALHVSKHVSPAMQSPGAGSPTLKWTLFHYW